MLEVVENYLSVEGLHHLAEDCIRSVRGFVCSCIAEVRLELVAAVPLLERFLGILGKMHLAFSGGDLAPRWCVVQHEAHVLRRFGKGSIYRRGERVDKLRPPRIVEPEEAPTKLAEVPLCLTGRHLAWSAEVVELRVVYRQVLLTFDLQGVRVGAEVDSVSATTGRLAADGAVARLVRVRCRGLDPEAHSPAMARTFK
jgi:hypothetical protein